MKFNKISHIILCIILILGAMATNDFSADARKKSKAKTSQTSSKKNSKGKSKNSKSSSKKGASNRKSRSKSSASSSGSRARSNRTPVAVRETPMNDSLTLFVNDGMLRLFPKESNPGGLRVNNVKLDAGRKTANISLNENYTYLPVNTEYINHLKGYATKALPDSLKDWSVNLSVSGKPLTYYVTTIDKLPEKYRKNTPFVTPAHPLANIKKGMDGDIVALWGSHGRYYRWGSWNWQRPLLFETLEDIYTSGYVVPFLAPMLENAGAYTLMPRERDTNRNEIIVDFDTNDEGEIYSQSTVKITNHAKRWEIGDGEGFIYDLPDFRDTENPFENGTYHQTQTIRTGRPSVMGWYADFPEDGEYAVYVSYKSLPNSTEDAHYTVNYSGGSREFRVNQTMGGGTWIYLGTFPFEAGFDDEVAVVTLTNESDRAADKIVTADAVKIGGGMGNIARSRSRSDIYYDPSTPDNSVASTQSKTTVEENGNDDENDNEDGDDDSNDEDDEDDDNDDQSTEDEDVDKAPADTPESSTTSAKKIGKAPSFSISGLPRYLEGARYWLHWAGFPEKVYSPYHGSDDYKDDYTCRGHWVNYLAGGSRVLPNREGLGIPVDMSFALHSDAGKRNDDSFVGTLGIYYTNNGASYVDGTPRKNSRFFTDMVMRQITSDVRNLYEPDWTRRSMWDKSYLESRVAEVPTTLIELMSHQNFADMQYGLDPNFRFDVSRAIYKAMARFMGERKGREVVIQPLAVKDFAITHTRKSTFRLSWQPTPDPLEPTAMPEKYIIFERSEDDLGFHKIGETTSTHFDVKVSDHEIHSFRIVAANDGGVSFPSETLALREGTDNSVTALIVNGFTRVSAPAHFSENGRAGFDSENDFGVPYIKDASFSGHQTEFRRSAGDGFGKSNGNYINTVIAGNTFDFAHIHGKALADNNIGFVSASVGAIENGSVHLSDYKIVDLILGKQKTTITGRGKAQKSEARYITFPLSLQKALRKYTAAGGNLIVTGQYVASDLVSDYATAGSEEFGEQVLGINYDDSQRNKSGKLIARANQYAGIHEGNYNYSNTLNEKNYIVENPDALVAAEGVNSLRFVEFSDSGLTAGLFNTLGKSRVAVLSVPFEAIPDETQRNALMKDIITFINK